MKYIFLENHTVKAAGGPTYTKGQVVELSYHSAQHFLKRNLVQEFQGQPKKAKQPEKVKPEPKAEPKEPVIVEETKAPEPFVPSEDEKNESGPSASSSVSRRGRLSIKNK